jgi:hypothetical protein
MDLICLANDIASIYAPGLVHRLVMCCQYQGIYLKPAGSPFNSTCSHSNEYVQNALCNVLASTTIPTLLLFYTSDGIVVKDKVNVSRALSVVAHKVLVALRPLLLGVLVQHALETDAHALDVMDWRPTRSIKKVEADDTVGVDVWVPWYGVVLVADEGDFWRLWEE